MKLPLMKELPSSRSCCRCVLPIMAFLFVAFCIASSFVSRNFNESILRPTSIVQTTKPMQLTCQTFSKPRGAELLPKGIISASSDLELQQLWDSPGKNLMQENTGSSKNLLALPVGIKQKEAVDRIVKKFISSEFTIMLFHYDGSVDRWRSLDWSNKAIHISVFNQTKWWFAKRFLHPDIVSEYDYVFLWDEDLDIENFNPKRYLSIIKGEGLEISQPALDPSHSDVHHKITVRSRRQTVHRRIYKSAGGTKCDKNSTGPPCTGNDGTRVLESFMALCVAYDPE